jgi:hypothetical protein
MLTREEIKQRQSIGGRKGAETRWLNNAQNTPKPDYHELPDPLITWQVTNHVSGKVTTMVFHPGSRRGRCRIDINGEPWQECGWSESTVKIRKSCKRTPLYIQ